MFLFGKQKTPKEILRENQRSLNKSMRELDRERVSLQNQEKKIILDIKKMAKQGQMNSAKIMAKDLVRTRYHIQKFYEMKTQLQAVSLRIQTLQSTQSMAEAMKGVTKAMTVMNRQMNLPQFTKIMMEFEQQSDKMDMKEEMMNDTMDDVMQQDGEEEESQEILNQVLDEIGIDLASQLVDAPTSTTATGLASKHQVNG
ncbi:SNF7 family protein [Cavenderia fasciculata]|uniref:SNF7 family protein n=1 Tax=Cavenderia fasciculata TaxID=261658 RepID=F4PTU5_CACFS|nr:SNF7 family protein [Cavenderia fasciculata]EGG20924.1 SNF7 family protein [Cavenderia fasciculata]|eukprot:XP_004358774.1 SNF7 family protein [Cavenderia fasciculata]